MSNKRLKMNSQYEITMGLVYNNLMAPDVESAIASFTGYIDTHYSDVYAQLKTPSGTEHELYVNGELYGKVIGLNPEGTSLLFFKEEKDENDDAKFAGDETEEDDFDESDNLLKGIII